MTPARGSEDPALRFVAVLGPTASGKSAVAIQWARHLRSEIICCDSVQLYRGFDIGSAKPTKGEQTEIPHHLFDAFAWNEPCDAALYAANARACIAKLNARGVTPVVVGGTGLYFRAVIGAAWDEGLPKDESLRVELSGRSSDELFAELEALDPMRAKQLHRNDRFRVIRALEINKILGAPVRTSEKSMPAAHTPARVIVMDPPRGILHQQIEARVRAMLASGLVEEVRSLLASGIDPHCKPMQSIGYAQVVEFLAGGLDEEELAASIAAATRQYAKRQCTWFKKVARDWTLAAPSDFNPALCAL